MIAGIVLAGGRGRRMGGADKGGLVVGTATILDRALAAARPLCQTLVVVGPVRPTAVAGVVFVQEPEPGAGGPVPAIAAGLAAATGAEVVLVLAGDMPLLTTGHLSRLLSALADHPVAAARDDRGRPTPLLAAYPVAALADRLGRLGHRLGGLAASTLLPPGLVAVDLGDRPILNVNTPADLERARALVDLAERPDGQAPAG